MAEAIAGLLGTAVGGTLGVGIIALIADWILRKLFPKIKKPLHASCVIAVLISSVRPLISWNLQSIDTVLAYTISGFLAFFLIRLSNKQWGKNNRGKIIKEAKEESSSVEKN